MTESVEISLERYNELIVKESRYDDLAANLVTLQKSLRHLVCEDIARYGAMMRYGDKTSVKASEIAMWLHMAISPSEQDFLGAMAKFEVRLDRESRREME